MRLLRRTAVCAAGIATVAALPLTQASAVAGTPYGLEPAAHRVVFTIRSPEITESSSLVVSGSHPGLVYTANDSGDGAHVYVLDDTGRLVGTTTLAGVEPIDIEAMADGGGSLLVGDIGDNNAERSSVAVYRIPEPGRGSHLVNPERVTLTYSDGPHNAEAMLYDARDGRVYVITKDVLAHVYATGPNAFQLADAVLHPVAEAPSIATDATLLPGGDVAVVRTYGGAAAYRFPSWHYLGSFDLPTQRQGESIAAVPGRAVVWVGSEGEDSPVLEVPLPEKVTDALSASPPGAPGGSSPSPAGGASPDGEAARQEPGGSDSRFVRIATSGAAIAVVTGLVLWLSRRRRSEDPPTR